LISAWAPPQTLLGELKAFLRLLSRIFGVLLVREKRKGKEEGERIGGKAV